MKELRLTFEDKEFAKLLKAKGEMTWHDFILDKLKGGKKNE